MSRKFLELRDLVRRRGISSETIAALIGCRARTVDRWITGHSHPSPIAKKALDRALRQIEQTLEGRAGE